MKRKGLIVFIVFIVFGAFLFYPFANTGSPDKEVARLFRQADSLLNLPELNEADSKVALNGFAQVIKLTRDQRSPAHDSLLFLSYRNTGILHEIAADYHSARNAYGDALSVRSFNNTDADSLIVMTYINLGTCYYYLNDFDSANYFLQRSDSIIERFPAIEYKVRLYNTLGVLYHDNGNYRQSKNYFSQALAIIKNNQPFDSLSAASVEINIATSLSRLEQYDEAISLYKKLLQYDLFNSHIYINMGKAYASLENYDQAMACFQKVDERQLPWVNNEIGLTYIKQQKNELAERYLAKVSEAMSAGKLNLADVGINKMYYAESRIQQGNYLQALDSLQQAIMIFANSRDADIFHNPTSFNGTFAYYRLFTALSRKAEIFKLVYQQSKEEKYLVAAHEAFKSTLALVSYIEKSFDTDDAKLFLKTRIRKVYQDAMNVSLSLAQLQPEKNYLEEAFIISEKNKASVVIGNLKERTITKMTGVDQQLLQKERNIKYNLARLSVLADRSKDTTQAAAINHEKEGYEIELARLRKNLEKNSSFYKMKYDDGYIDVNTLQKKIDKNKSLIAFYALDSAIHVFVIGSNSFNHVRIDSVEEVRKHIAAWTGELKQYETGRRFSADLAGKRIYQLLVKPFYDFAKVKEEWIIIPDGFLYSLPFESLETESGTTLLEEVAISYQFSSRFINEELIPESRSIKKNQVLAFAPFNKSSGKPGKDMTFALEELPSSAEEVGDLEGKKFLHSDATKANFLREINHYPIIHLATHAVADESESSRSFIAFYTSSDSLQKNLLFIDEVYGLNMDSTELVVISACETGKGKLVSSEGVLSLSRAFIYAGCKSAVNSLWKADDQSTAFILKKFHQYLQKGLSKAKALQQAKLDYIKTSKLNKGPAYWSHLVIVGNTEPLYMTGSLLWVPIVVGIALGIFLILRKRKKKSTLFMDLDKKNVS